MNRSNSPQTNLDPHDAPTTDLGDPMNQGVDLHADDPLPDLPDAGPDSQPISSPDLIDFSTKGLTAAGSVGMSTFNDRDDQTLFERTTDAFAESGIESPMVDEQATVPIMPSGVGTGRRFRVRIYDQPA